jgi:putative methyltransferase (TIGR04325 family)
VLRRLRIAAFGRPVSEAPSTRLFASYADALELCGGYEEAELLDVIAAKTTIVRDQTAPLATAVSESDVHTLLALTTCALTAKGPALKVLDFGGACGAHYYHMRRLAPQRPLHWTIVETAGMAGRANRLAAGDTCLSAFTSVADAVRALDGTVDLVHASGALQCTPDPYAALQALLEVRASVLLLTRGAVTTGDDDIVVIHESSLASNGPGSLPPQFQDRPVSYPFVFASRDRLLAQLRAVYRRVLLLPDHTGCFPVNCEPVHGFAALCSEPC